MKRLYEIKSKETGKVIYSASADNPAFEWNRKKKRLLMGWDKDAKLKPHIEKYGIQDLILALPERKSTETVLATETKTLTKKGGRKKK